MPAALNAHEKEFYCYLICDPRKPGKFMYETSFGRFELDCEPMYAGKGKGRRSASHVKVAKRTNRNTPLHNKIRAILDAGLEPVVIRTKRLYDEHTSFRIEEELINCIGRKELKSGPLVNLSDGGEGPAGHKHTKRVKKKIGEASLLMHLFMPEEKKRDRQDKISVNGSAAIQLLSKEERVARATKASAAAAKTFAGMTKLEKRVYSNKISKGVLAAKARMTPEQQREATAKNLAARAAHTPERRALRNERLRATLAAKAGKAEQERVAKIKKAKAHQPTVTCPHCDKVGKLAGMKSHHFDNCKFIAE